MRSHWSPKTRMSVPTTSRSTSIGSAPSAGPSAAVQTASAPSAAADPSSGARQPRAVPSASTIVSASTISTALASAAERTSSGFPVIAPTVADAPCRSRRRSSAAQEVHATVRAHEHVDVEAEPGGRLLRAPDAEQVQVTVYFWVIKVLCTTVGETASDYLSENVGLGLTTTPATGLVASRGALRRARIPPTVSMRRRPGPVFAGTHQNCRALCSRTGPQHAWLSEIQ